MREEEQRGSAPEPCPAGLRARPPRLPPAPPAVEDMPPGGGVPESVEELLRAFHGCVRETGTIRQAISSPASGADTVSQTYPPEEARAPLLHRIAELRARLLLGDADLSDPLLRIYQDQLLSLALTNAPELRGTAHLSAEFQARVIGKALGLAEETPAAWRQFPFSSGRPVMALLYLPPRGFFRRVLDQIEAAVRDPDSYDSLERFDEAVARRMAAGFAGALAVADWVRERGGAEGPERGKL